MSKRILLLIVILLLGLTSCAPKKAVEEQKLNRKAEIVKGPWRLTLTTPKTEYKKGESIALVFNLRNEMELPLVLRYPNGQTYDFRVIHKTRPVYQWSKGRAFTQQVIQEEILPYHETKIVAEWDQKSNGGKQVESGIYTIKARLTPQVLSDEISLDIAIVD